MARCLAKNPADRPSAEEVARRFAPGQEAALEWPPPGLEGLQGKAYVTLYALMGAVVLLAFPLALAMELAGSVQASITEGWSGTVLSGLAGVGAMYCLLFGLGLGIWIWVRGRGGMRGGRGRGRRRHPPRRR